MTFFEFEDVHEVTDIRFKLQKKKYVGRPVGGKLRTASPRRFVL